MSKLNITFLLTVTATCLLLSACGSSAVHSVSDEELTPRPDGQTYSDLLIVGVYNDRAYRVSSETTFAEELKTRVDGAEAEFGEFAGNVDGEMQVAQEKLDGLEAERAKRLSDDVDKESLTLYERLLAAREGVALAELEGKICQGCHMEVPSNLYVKVARGTSLAQCPSCDRIFYIREE